MVFSSLSQISPGLPLIRSLVRTSLVVLWLRLQAPNAGGLGLIPGQRTRSHMLQLRIFTPQLKKKDPSCHSKDQGSCMLQLRASIAKQIGIENTHTLVIGFMVDLDHPAWSRTKILNLITPAKTLFPNKVIFIGSRYADADISFEGPPFSSGCPVTNPSENCCLFFVWSSASPTLRLLIFKDS